MLASFASGCEYTSDKMDEWTVQLWRDVYQDRYDLIFAAYDSYIAATRAILIENLSHWKILLDNDDPTVRQATIALLRNMGKLTS